MEKKSIHEIVSTVFKALTLAMGGGCCCVVLSWKSGNTNGCYSAWYWPFMRRNLHVGEKIIRRKRVI